MLLRSTVVLAEDVARPNRAGRQADMQVMDRTSNVGEASSARKKLWGISATRHDFEGKWQRWQTADGQESEAQQAGVPMHGWTIIRPPHIVAQRWYAVDACSVYPERQPRSWLVSVSRRLFSHNLWKTLDALAKCCTNTAYQ